MIRIGSRSTGRPTLNEVARLAAVSPITASRALRGVTTVAPELVEKVRAAAQSLGYVANPAARALASSCSQTVVVLVPSLSNQLFIETLEAIQDVLRPRGLDVVIGNYHYSPEEEEKLLRNHLVNRPRGILLTGFDRTPASHQMLEASGIPCVHMMELDPRQGAYSVGFSQEQAGAQAALHLLGRGRTRLAYMAAQLDTRVLQRGAGFRQVLEDAGLFDAELQVTTPLPSSIGLGGELFARLLDEHPDVDGIFFCNDDLAQGASLEALRLGVAIPQRVSLVGFNDLPGSAHMVPRLTSIRTPRQEVGQRAAQVLLGLLDGLAQQARVDLGFELVVRESS
ncbi:MULTISPECIES: LacI family DNA-binding transcriptional regulator [Pseudomonas syringae group]|uniref:Gluconate utilization system GNT-I transcriptional repressor n=1 Tax=Pseudomonas syringae pv. ribicola TaxID=55398 RepID=A0A0N8SPY1_PSESI|nr:MULTISPECIES: LacI family DNA-binding transcriptional regulator [Pseudomonas syringae group]MCF9019085.1 LacI family DNA-binding transcriptional regulator [Pseudomonas syringae]EKN46463.1 gluconate utilization system GNT-I transcriptional repressor [Pseudomonas viridiflava UASWS0038]KPL63245.1 LacI family transcriptional regulator [Pseudomonas viridiflava]KPY47656.1 Gluconate utilization system GNT-I transcriptional repressor [Pseudomonas syringae pv. ribicola]KPZ23208.1 Gluconate utilizati